ncbi:MAG TPA: zinc-ribbon domain-containing protein [Gemmatimonadales bacterium]
MNVTCPNCATVYRVDPSKVPEAGVRARCAVCSAVFPVSREGREAPVAQPPRQPAAGQPTMAAAAPPPPPPVAAPTAQAAAPTASPVHAPPMSPPAPAAAPVSRPVAPAAPSRPVTPPAPSFAAGAPPRPASPARVQPPGSPSTPPPASPPAFSQQAPPSPPSAPRPTAPAGTGGRPANPFLSQDPSLKARRLARALISDIVVYHPAKRQEGIRDGNLKELFEEEIKKSWEEYTEQVGREVAESTGFFREALNEILAGGRQVF